MTPTIAAAGILEGCARELARVRTAAAHDGWDRGLAERVLAPLRIASAVALAHPFSQIIVSDGGVPRQGEMLLHRGRLRPRKVLVSSRVTADMIARRLGRGGDELVHRRTRDLLRTLGQSLQVFTATRYGRSAEPDSAALQTALEEASTAVRQLRVAAFWPVRIMRTGVQSAVTWRNAAWRR